MNEVTLFEAITLVGGLVGIYVKMTQEVGKLKGRMAVVEADRDEVRATLKELVAMVQEIKLLLAKKGIDS